ncbi:MAG: peptide chain release factor N(5)-glutamine methyltransferase [Cypionkella sp.]|nr:peptide chain release factor N(5)-glutamine methyltransferase [Cypionkella sp.]
MSAHPSAAQLLQSGIAALKAAGIDSAAGDARILLADAMGISLDRLTLHLPDTAGERAETIFPMHIAARAQHKPVAQITGRRMFWGRNFVVTQDTLDPRPETEILVAQALRGSFDQILDLGTGTGCILLSLLAERPNAQGVGSDVSPRALDVARRNAENLGLTPRAQFVHSDWFAAILQRFDLIVANPPYIAADELPHLSQDVREWEPHLALTDGGDGLAAYRAIAAGAGAHLAPNGRILLEIGPSQGAAVCALLTAQAFENVTVLQDFDGRDRVVCAQKPTNAV